MNTTNIIIRIFLFIFLWTVIYFYSLSLINSIVYKVPQISSFKSDLIVMRKWLVKYNLEWKNFIDMWSWIWKIIRFFENEFKCKTTWYEIDASNVMIARFLNLLFKNKRKVIKKNYFESDLSKYDVIYIYLFPSLIEKIEEKINKEVKKWTLVISNAFKLKNKKPKEILYNDKWKEEVYIYKY